MENGKPGGRGKTFFLPAKRESASEIRTQYEAFRASPLRGALDRMPILVAVLNECRQIVFCSDSLLEFLGKRPDDVLGLRPGEALGCEHGCEPPDGCGTTAVCRYCGAANAIVRSLGKVGDTQECHITRAATDGPNALNVQVWTTPLFFAGRLYVLMSLIDIYHEKQMQLFERMFLHDMLNLAGGIKTLSEILFSETEGETKSDAETLLAASGRLFDSLNSQRELTAAEANTLAVRPVKMGSTLVLEQARRLFDRQEVAAGKLIVLAPDSKDLYLESDVGLLNRIMVNLVKNGLEASQPGDTVTLRSVLKEGRVVFSVRNPGVMPDHVQAHVFKRLYSTKGRGRGLGTYIVKLLTERYLQGEARFTSTAEHGTEFTVILPQRLTPA